MRNFFVPSIIILGIIAFYVIIDRKDVINRNQRHHNPAIGYGLPALSLLVSSPVIGNTGESCRTERPGYLLNAHLHFPSPQTILLYLSLFSSFLRWCFFMVFSFCLFILFLSAAGTAWISYRTEEAASPPADDLQLQLLRPGESAVLSAGSETDIFF